MLRGPISFGTCQQVDALQQELERRGFSCWYDNKMQNLTKEAMAEGVRESSFVILFLSQGVLERPFARSSWSAQAQHQIFFLQISC